MSINKTCIGHQCLYIVPASWSTRVTSGEQASTTGWWEVAAAGAAMVESRASLWLGRFQGSGFRVGCLRGSGHMYGYRL